MIEEAVKRFSKVPNYGPDRFDPFDRGGAVKVFDRDRERTFYHSGDIGDVIYALPTIRALGGGDLVLGPEMKQDVKVVVRQAMTEKMVAMLKPLLLLQPYIRSVRYAPKMPEVDVDLNKFREELVVDSETLRDTGAVPNLAESHLKRFHLRLDECDMPWLVVDKALPVEDHPVVFHRSARWRNRDFPWREVVRRYGEKALFVGLREEYEDFRKEWGYVNYAPVSNFLEMARLIAGCELYVGNQSFPYALAEGMKKTTLLEVCPEVPNCIFRRPNANYGLGKTVYIPNLRRTMVEETLTKCPMCLTEEKPVKVREPHDIVRCPECSLVYLRTRMDASSMEEHYQHYADGDSHMRIPKEVAEVRTTGLRRDYFMQELLKHTGNARGRLLDIGSGWGAWLANARSNGFTAAGVEICAKMAEFASGILGIPTETRQLEQCNFSSESYYVVSAIHTLEHLPNPFTAWHTVHRILTKGGIFCGIVPNFESLCSAAQKSDWMWLDPKMHYCHYTPVTLNKALEDFGFEVLSLVTATGDYSKIEVGKVIQQNNPMPLSEEEMEQRIKQINEQQEGEEIRWFAKKL